MSSGISQVSLGEEVEGLFDEKVKNKQSLLSLK